MKEGALVLYGRGGGLGNFKFFADDLVNLELKRRFGKNVDSFYTTRRADALDKIEQSSFAIGELHIFTHAIGGGLFLSYGESAMSTARQRALQAAAKLGRRVNYSEVVQTEEGAILSDHLVQSPLAGRKTVLRNKFAKKASIKIWGCNSGVVDWHYSDDDGVFYWQALNLKNTPKPAIAQALADFFGVVTLGARSGANIQVKHKGRWIYADTYMKLTGRYAGEPEVLRLNPTRGGFVAYEPTP